MTDSASEEDIRLRDLIISSCSALQNQIVTPTEMTIKEFYDYIDRYIKENGIKDEWNMRLLHEDFRKKRYASRRTKHEKQ
jgi:hypothetical protein